MIDDDGRIRIHAETVCNRVLFFYFFAPLVPFPGVNFFGNKKRLKTCVSPLTPSLMISWTVFPGFVTRRDF